MVVGAEAAERNECGRSGEAGIAEIIILIFQLARPVLGEHVFDTGADGPAIGVVAGECERHPHAGDGVDDRLVVVGKAVAALYVDQAGTPSITEAAGQRAEPVLVVGIDGAAGENDAAIVAGNPAVLGLGTNHPVRAELVIGAALQAAEEPAVAVVAGRQATEIGVV